MARAIAILLVVMVHVWLFVIAPAVSTLSPGSLALFRLADAGAAGVGLFFVISGYLLNLLYSASKFSPKVYWMRRLARIYPAWIFWTLVAVAAAISVQVFGLSVSPYGASVVPDSPLNVLLLVLHLLFLGFLMPSIWNSVIPGGWSIQAEIFNYALFPLVRRFPFWVVLLVAIGAELVQFVVFSFPNAISASADWSRIVSTYLTSPVWFVCGIFLSRYVHRERSAAAVREGALEASLVAICLAFAALVGLSGPFVSQATTLVIVLGATAVSYLVVRSGRWRWLAEIGKYSYGIYFGHLLFLAPLGWAASRIASAIGPSVNVGWAAVLFAVTYSLALALSFATARLVFELVEKRPLRWARERTSKVPMP